MSTSHSPAPSQSFAESVAIAGVGLIGGSIAAALRQRGFRGRIFGIGRSAERLDAARQSGLIDEGFTEARAAAAVSDLIVFCTPVDQIVGKVLAASQGCRAGTLITDAGSVKGRICRSLAGRLPEGVTFIGSHPLAGSEKQGFEHARADLYNGRVCVLTPIENSPDSECSRLQAFWEFLGARVLTMSPEDHDAALAVTSHMPHVAAAAVAMLLDERLRPFAATGFRDTTRIAAGDPDLWVAILQQNASEVVRALDELDGVFSEFRRAIATGDALSLKNLLEAAKTNRDAL